MLKFFDNTLSFAKRSQLAHSVQTLDYRISHQFDSQLTRQQQVPKLIKHLSAAEWEGFEIVDNNSEIQDILKDHRVERAWVNLSTPGESSYQHVDQIWNGCITVLYYVNLVWDESWSGATIWNTGNQTIASEFVPGRIAVFDSTIPHRGLATSLNSPYRFTINSVWSSK